MKVRHVNNKAKLLDRHVNRCLAANLSPPEEMTVKELKYMLRCPEIFLAGCSSAEPVSASFRHNKYSFINVHIPNIKYS